MSQSQGRAAELLLSIFSLGDYEPTVKGFEEAEAESATNELTIPAAHLATATKSIFETADKLGGEVAIAIINNGFALAIATKHGEPVESWQGKLAQSMQEAANESAQRTERRAAQVPKTI